MSFGQVPIQRIKFEPKHPHVMIITGEDENITVGLKTNNSSGDLIPVTYSNGNKAYMKRTATRTNSKVYFKKVENYTLDSKSEAIAYRIATNNLLKDISSTKKKR